MHVFILVVESGPTCCFANSLQTQNPSLYLQFHFVVVFALELYVQGCSSSERAMQVFEFAALARQTSGAVKTIPAASCQLLQDIAHGHDSIYRTALRTTAVKYGIEHRQVQRRLAVYHSTLLFVHNSGMQITIRKLAHDVRERQGRILSIDVHVRPDETPMSVCILDQDDDETLELQDVPDDAQALADTKDEMVFRGSAPAKLVNGEWFFDVLCCVDGKYVLFTC